MYRHAQQKVNKNFGKSEIPARGGPLPPPSPAIRRILSQTAATRARHHVEMDFESVEGLEVRGYRLASIDLIEARATSGDAYLVCPDGRQIDLVWRSERPQPSGRWTPPSVPGGTGVIIVEITEVVAIEEDLGPVLEAAVKLMPMTLRALSESS